MLFRSHEQETKTIEYFILQQLNEEEEKEWEQISIIRDEQTYNSRKNEFIRAKKEKYLRAIQKKFALNAERSMNIVNEYIGKKQKYFSYRKRFWIFLTRNVSWFVNILICIIFAGILLWVDFRDQEMKSTFTVTSTIILYLVIPFVIRPIENCLRGKR